MCENNNNCFDGDDLTTTNKDFTNYALPDDVMKEGISTLNTLLHQELQKLKQEEYDFIFLNKVLTDKKLCGRFIWYNCGNINNSLQQVLNTGKWRKEFGIAELKRSDLEMYIVKDGIFTASRFDVNGDRIIYMVLKNLLKNKSKDLDNKRSYIYCKDRIIRTSPTNKLTLVLDCNGAGFANDIMFAKGMIEQLVNYYPNALGHALVYDMPWILNVFWNMIKMLLPKHYREKVKFVNKETIHQYISKENLPKRMGGDDTDERDHEFIEYLYGSSMKET